MRTLDLYPPETESLEMEECPLIRVTGTHSYGRDNTCRECARPRGRVVRDGKE